MGLWLDNRFFPDDGNTETSDEYGHSAAKTGITQPDADGNTFTQWQDRPVLRTDQSFTVSAWAMLEPGLEGDGGRTVIAQRGAHESAFWIKYDPVFDRWQFNVGQQDDPAAAVATGHVRIPGAGRRVDTADRRVRRGPRATAALRQRSTRGHQAVVVHPVQRHRVAAGRAHPLARPDDPISGSVASTMLPSIKAR